ncbi:hypothetical protein BST61_g8083 [Cercospora zeina]
MSPMRGAESGPAHTTFKLLARSLSFRSAANGPARSNEDPKRFPGISIDPALRWAFPFCGEGFMDALAEALNIMLGTFDKNLNRTAQLFRQSRLGLDIETDSDFRLF